MKTLVIGDIHGRNQWKFITANEEYDRVVFLGDYFDSREIKYDDQIKNFEDILSFKSDSPDKVILLYGNHDHSYYNNERCSGYKPEYADKISEILKEADQLSYLQAVHIQGDIIMSHAGISDFWLKNVAHLNNPGEVTLDDLSIFNFNYLMGFDPYGDSISQSPIWIRLKSLSGNLLSGYRQIVGHTSLKKPAVIRDLIYCNDLMSFYYIVVEDGEILYKDNTGKIVEPVRV